MEGDRRGSPGQGPGTKTEAGSVMVSSPLLLTFGTLSLLLYFRLPSTFLPSKGRSITTLGTRWHDFFITLFRYFTIVLFFTLHFFSFSQGMQTRERAHCARSVFPFIKKKKKKGEQDRATPDQHRHHKSGRRKRGPKEPQFRSRSHARASASATPLLNTRMTASTSQRRHGATARVRPTHGTRHRRHREPGPAPSCPGIRSQKENGDR